MASKKVKRRRRKVSEARSYEPRNGMPMPPAEDLAAGIVSPLDVPVNSRIPYMRRKNVQGRRLQNKRFRATWRRNNRLVLVLGGFEEEVHRTVKRLRKNKRRKSRMGLPINDKSPLEDAPKLQEMDEELLVQKNTVKVCNDVSCRAVRRYGSSTTGLQSYSCFHYLCRIPFESFTELFEHQLEVHGRVMPRDHRTVADLYHQQRGKHAPPPPTVYLGQQYMCPSRPPTPWKSMDEVHEEANTLETRLFRYQKNIKDLNLLMHLFLDGYDKVLSIGPTELDRQYHQAMEHYYAAFKFPASSRGFRDGFPAVERGRNWLTSTEREDVRYLHPFSLNDPVTAEPEFVLIDTKRDKEMSEGLSDGWDAEGDDDDSVFEEKILKLDDDEDEEMKSSETASVQERKVSEVGSDSDDDVTVKSESVESDTESKPANSSATGDNDSDSDEDGDEEEEKKGDGRDRKRGKRDSSRNRPADDANSVSGSESDDEAEEDDGDGIFNQLE